MPELPALADALLLRLASGGRAVAVVLPPLGRAVVVVVSCGEVGACLWGERSGMVD